MSEESVFTILEVPITLLPEKELLDKVEKSDADGKGLFITTPNPEIIVEAQKDATYKKILQSSDIALPDGTGVVFVARSYGQVLERIRGREFFIKLLDLANKNHWTVYLLGSTEEVMGTSIERIGREYPQIRAKGSAKLDIDKEGISRSKTDEQQIVNDLKNFSPHLLFVALGHPKQEKFIYRMRELFPTTTMMAIGGTLDTFSGVLPIAPKWMSDFGLEWLFRLSHEPKRIGRIKTALFTFPLMVLKKKK